MANKILLTDIDNTLYDWPAFFAPSFRAMVHALARELALPEDKLYREFKTVYATHDSLEYSFAIQELASVQHLGIEEIRYLIRLGRGAFLRVQRHRLQPYPGVPQTLKWLLEQGYLVVGITNAPIFLAQKRLFNLRLDSLLTGLVAWEGFEPTNDPANLGFVPLSRRRFQTRLKKSVTVPLSDCKPSRRQYEAALNSFAGADWEAWAIGDSLSKDLEPAAKLGIRTIWAHYGAGSNLNDENTETLLKITPWSPSKIARTHSKTSFNADVTINSFQELTSIIPPSILPLF